MIPNLDSEIGISVYSTTFPGIGGKIRVVPEDFIVTEIISDKTKNSVSDQEGYAVYKLKKKKIDTNHALSGIFKKKAFD
ncbi:tRNA pseudouridine(13) synthase TruD [Nitrosopumilus adriaticus]|uniref:tRNA pseudouridine(13) synthase TruD n=1 Tax=Nitrosopumilus adriaticus TaxID=1580092 RepID=UPI000ACD6B64|nr:tRNA pseudouridine(13) synthase TruD [Nitrosopumilus adriaticus]